jgi:NitT/TauT family transport system permease protein
VVWFEVAFKAAVVVLMTFFNAGVHPGRFAAAGKLGVVDAQLRRQLLRCTLRLPAALPFIFGALRVNATLALIGASWREFFSSPPWGWGLFRPRPRA